MRSYTTFSLQYAHRFYGFKGEAQYLHGHTGVLTIEVEDSIDAGVNMVFPCNEIQKTAWDILRNFDHALILREDDPLLPAILDVYEKQGIKNGHPQNKMKGPAFKTDLATAYPDCRLVVTKETMTVEGMIKIVYDLLKTKLKHRKDHLHQRSECRFPGIPCCRHGQALPSLRNCPERKRRLSQVRIQGKGVN